MRTWKSLVLTLTFAAAVWAPATASAAFEHVVAKGETLSSVAAADGLSVAQLAAANGMSPDSQLISGSSLAIPPQDASAGESAVSSPATAAVTSAAPVSSGGGLVVQRGDTLSAIAGRLGVSVNALAAANGLNPSGLLIAGTTLHSAGSSSAGVAAPSDEESSESTGGLVVQRGDTLSALASRMGVTVQALAAANGLDPTGLLIAGTTLHSVGGGSSSAAPATTEMVSTSPSSGGGAVPTAEMVSPATVGSIAASEGVPASLAEAVGYQESGFNNGMVSHTGAVGVMQIMPSTWDWIGQHLAGPPPLSTTSASDNIRAGSLLLHSLLSDTGGNAEEAIAGYYQGLGSVQAHGMYSDTRAYVNNVMALQQRFGGG